MRLGLKILMVLALTLAILIPLMMIGGVVGERQAYQAQAVQTVAASYAGAQSLAGPVLVVPYVETIESLENDAKGVPRTVRREQSGRWTYFPDALDIVGTLKPSSRTLGLYDVRVYELDAIEKASFRVDIPDDVGQVVPRRIGRPWLSYGLADVRGLAGAPRLTVDGRELTLQQGIGHAAGTGVHARIAAPPAGQPLVLETALTLALGGTEALSIAPLGKRNRIAIDSTWPHPQFNGAFLPRSKRIDDNGFHATWEVSSLATNAQAQYLQGNAGTTAATAAAVGASTATDPDERAAMQGAVTGAMDTIGISLVDPVNPYSQADRATKYGLLFVALTFVGFFMFELIKQLRIHPIQYALVGLALAIFFLLLVSLSEHIAFGWAYLVASVACIGLLGVYVGAVLGSTWRGIGFAAMLATLYGALYGLLVSEDNALVMGAGLLFVILAAIMLVTRRIDWYALSANVRS